ncbi:hypothetical protein WAI453_006356 [Rhynchosporium graminicola]
MNVTVGSMYIRMDSLGTAQTETTAFLAQVVQCSHQDLRLHRMESHTQGSSLDKKLGQVERKLETINSHFQVLSLVKISKDTDFPTSEIQRAAKDISASIFMLISSIHSLIRELVNLLAPYFVVLYGNTFPVLEYDFLVLNFSTGRKQFASSVLKHHRSWAGNKLHTFFGRCHVIRQQQILVINLSHTQS